MVGSFFSFDRPGASRPLTSRCSGRGSRRKGSLDPYVLSREAEGASCGSSRWRGLLIWEEPLPRASILIPQGGFGEYPELRILRSTARLRRLLVLRESLTVSESEPEGCQDVGPATPQAVQAAACGVSRVVSEFGLEPR